MTDNSIGKSRGGWGPPVFVELAKNAPAMMWTFTLTTFLSALLLFAIQPMFAKMVLPVLGGSPSVWSVSVFFFQAALLAGYIYAHLLINKVPAQYTGIVHLAVCILSFVCLPIALLGYPFVLEPLFGVSQLSHIWAYVFAALVVLIGASFFLMRGAHAGGVP